MNLFTTLTFFCLGENKGRCTPYNTGFNVERTNKVTKVMRRLADLLCILRG